MPRTMTRTTPEERKQQIIAAATAVFTRKGFHQASMADIVKEAQVSKGGLYWHFENKEAIVTAVLEQFFQGEIEEVIEVMASSLLASQKIEQITRQIMRDTESQLGPYRNIWLEFYAVAAREGGFRDQLLQYMEQFIELYRQLFQEGIDSGEFRPVSAQEMAVLTMAQFEGLILLWAIQPDVVDILAISATAVEHFLRALKQ